MVGRVSSYSLPRMLSGAVGGDALVVPGAALAFTVNDSRCIHIGPALGRRARLTGASATGCVGNAHVPLFAASHGGAIQMGEQRAQDFLSELHAHPLL